MKKTLLALLAAVATSAAAEFDALVTTREELEAVASGLAGSYALGADIDLSGGGWTPIGTSSRPFTGSFDAQGHKIAGLRYDDSSGSCAGLFGCVKDATLDGIRLEGVSVNGRQYTGALAGDVRGATTIRNCSAEGVVSNSYGCAGLLVGRVYGAGTSFENCAATGAVVSSAADTGGFVGSVYYHSARFADCDADVRVTGTGGNNKGGFVGSVRDGKASATFARCTARGDVIAANGSANVGGFVGQTAVDGIRYALCRALGSATTAGRDAGGFAGYVSRSNDIWRCMSAGAATGSYEVGGFIGYQGGGGTVVRECFALGDATATNDGDALAGGFVGYVYDTASFSDCYALGTVRGLQRAGGFAGKLCYSPIAVARCYAAGVVDCRGAYAGAFVGHLQAAAAFADCAALGEGVHAVGSSSAGASAEDAAIAELDADGMKSTGNFDAFRATGLWAQADGVTQPYLAWSAPTGDLAVYASVGGSARGEVEGAGDYAPGATATVTAVSDEGFFLAWTGSTPYADPTAPTTEIVLDNHRVATVRFGRLVRTADELDAVRDDLAGDYGLANDIDLAGRDWTPIGFNGAKFTGTFHGFGHAIANMVCTNSPSVQRRGLFGWTSGAVLDGIAVSGVLKSTAYCAGGLVGRADATTIRDCHADVAVSSTTLYAGGLVGSIGDGTTVSDCSAAGTVTSSSRYAGGLAGGCAGGTFAIRDSVSTAEVSGGESAGGFIGYLSCAAAEISGCRSDGHAVGGGNVGGFVGCIGGSGAVSVSNCAARGDVRSSAKNYGGFVGNLDDGSATITDCWSAGAVWGTGANAGSFAGCRSGGAIEGCATSARANGARAFCGSGAATGGALADDEVSRRSDGWPEVEPRWKAATPIATAGELAAITNGGVYRLEADIDLGGAAWTPIGASGAGFTGELYGQGHAISNFTVNATTQHAGLFGSIAGGRVSGVQAFGRVSTASSHAGGFAGGIGSRSLVEDCSFVGTVSSSSTQVGGFAGALADQPSVVECCAVGTVSKTGSDNGYVGGFVGRQTGGFVADSYARVTVGAGGAGHAGGFAGASTGAKIVRTYCSGEVSTSSANCVGAFGGSVGPSVATNSCYDAGATARAAVDSAAYAGVDPVAADSMKGRAGFPAFDFEETWSIEEGRTTPYLRRFYEFAIRSFADWVADRNLPSGSRPEEVVNGIPLAARYVFGIDSMDDILNADGEPVFRVAFDGNGEPFVQFAEHVRGTDQEVRLDVLATTDVADWADPQVVPVDLDVGVAKPDCSEGVPATMFFKWRITIAD